MLPNSKMFCKTFGGMGISKRSRAKKCDWVYTNIAVR